MRHLFDTTVDIKIRLFYVLAIICCAANTLGVIANLVFYGVNGMTIFCGVCAILMYALTIVGTIGEKRKLATGGMLLLINIFEFPLLFYVYGSGRIPYMVLGIVGLVTFVFNRRRLVYAFLAGIYDMAVMIFAVLHPYEKMVYFSTEDIGASVASFAIVFISLSFIVILLIYQYETQNQKLQELTEELTDMAKLDPLTQLYNRRYLTEYLDEKMAIPDTELSVALIDIDDFKSVNDRFGHVYGDRVLTNLAQYMREEIEGKGIAARFGGEEFMLVFLSADEEEIKAIASRIGERFFTFGEESKQIPLTFSGGVETYHNEDRITQIFNAADQKLYEAKHSGKNRLIFKSAMKKLDME